jgi:hypothetical protein
MQLLRKKFMESGALIKTDLFLILLIVCFSAACQPPDNTDNSTKTTTTSPASSTTTTTVGPRVDVHAHISREGTSDFVGAAGEAVAAMDAENVDIILVLPPPFTPEKHALYECDDYSGVRQEYPGRFGFLCGGGNLNSMVQEAVAGKPISQEDFKNEARRLANSEGFVGFGEFTGVHFCMGSNHEYIYAPPDHALFKALVDVASEENAPIDFHMEAVPQAMAFPEFVTGGCTLNPSTLEADIPAFKSLLDYAKSKTPAVKII